MSAYSDGEETYERLAQTVLPDGKVGERPWTPSERYQLFARGFRDGAGATAMSGDHVGLGAYDRGYAQGVAAKRAACSAYAEEIQYAPTILRLATGDGR